MEGLSLCGLKHFLIFSNGADLPGQADGSGCAIASRYPILDTAWMPFSACGTPYRIDQWDWQAGKGIGLARVLLPGEMGTADVYVSHLVAQYSDGPRDEYAQQRVLQALEASIFIRSTRRSDLTLLLADLNAGPDTLVYRTLATLAGFKDAYSCTHTPEEELLYGSTLTETRALSAAAVPLPNRNSGSYSHLLRQHGPSLSQGVRNGINAPKGSDASSKTTGDTTLRDGQQQQHGHHVAGDKSHRSIYDATFGVPGNTFAGSAFNNADRVRSKLYRTLSFAHTETPECDINSRLDYILFGSGAAAWPFPAQSLTPNGYHRAWHVVTSDIRLTETITLQDGTRINLSDHSAVYAEFACVLIAPPMHLQPAAAGAGAVSPVIAGPQAVFAGGSGNASGQGNASGSDSISGFTIGGSFPGAGGGLEGRGGGGAVTDDQAAASMVADAAAAAAGASSPLHGLTQAQLQQLAQDSATAEANAAALSIGSSVNIGNASGGITSFASPARLRRAAAPASSATSAAGGAAMSRDQFGATAAPSLIDLPAPSFGPRSPRARLQSVSSSVNATSSPRVGHEPQLQFAGNTSSTGGAADSAGASMDAAAAAEGLRRRPRQGSSASGGNSRQTSNPTAGNQSASARSISNKDRDRVMMLDPVDTGSECGGLATSCSTGSSSGSNTPLAAFPLLDHMMEVVPVSVRHATGHVGTQANGGGDQSSVADSRGGDGHRTSLSSPGLPRAGSAPQANQTSAPNIAVWASGVPQPSVRRSCSFTHNDERTVNAAQLHASQQLPLQPQQQQIDLARMVAMTPLERAREAERLLRDAIIAAGVPIDRVAGLASIDRYRFGGGGGGGGITTPGMTPSHSQADLGFSQGNSGTATAAAGLDRTAGGNQQTPPVPQSQLKQARPGAGRSHSVDSRHSNAFNGTNPAAEFNRTPAAVRHHPLFGLLDADGDHHQQQRHDNVEEAGISQAIVQRVHSVLRLMSAYASNLGIATGSAGQSNASTSAPNPAHGNPAVLAPVLDAAAAALESEVSRLNNSRSRPGSVDFSSPPRVQQQQQWNQHHDQQLQQQQQALQLRLRPKASFDASEVTERGETEGPQSRSALASASWRPVLREVLVSMDKGLKQTLTHRNRQVALGMWACVAAAVLLYAALRISTRPHDIAYGAAIAVVLSLAQMISLLVLLRMRDRSNQLYSMLAVAAVVVPATALLMSHGGIAATLTAWAIWCVFLAWGAVWSSVSYTAKEARAYRRAHAQLRILLQRPPAVVA